MQEASTKNKSPDHSFTVVYKVLRVVKCLIFLKIGENVPGSEIVIGVNNI